MRIFLCLCLVSLAVAKKTFSGDEVLTLHPANWDQANLIKKLNNVADVVDFWNPEDPRRVHPGHSVDIRIPSDLILSLKQLFSDNEIKFEVKIDDVQVLIDNQFSRTREVKDAATHSYEEFNSYELIVEWAKQIAIDHSSIAMFHVLANSTEDRSIPMVTISTNMDNPAIIVDCGIHGREWIAPAFCQCYTRNLVEGYGKDTTITNMLDQLTIHVIPVVNVDGYAYTHSEDRMWRKTRSQQQGSFCYGVDPNRNFNAMFGGPGASSSPCSETYHGPYFESEPEVKAIADLIRGHEHGHEHRMMHVLKGYITFHSYGQMILYPYSYKFTPAATADYLDSYAKMAYEAVKSPYGTEYIYGQGASTIYRASGGSDDFAYDTHVPLSYTVELRDNGDYGFLLPENQISSVCTETFNMMRVFEQAAIDAH